MASREESCSGDDSNKAKRSPVAKTKTSPAAYCGRISEGRSSVLPTNDTVIVLSSPDDRATLTGISPRHEPLL
jgi:hypothetical protein